MATSALDRLYQIDTPEALEECLNAFLTEFKPDATLASKRLSESDYIIDAINGNAEVSKLLYQHYADGLRKAVDYVKVGDNLSDRWHANIDRFAAYKAYHITQELREAERRYAGDPELRDAVQQSIVRKYNRYQAAEEQTARHRARAGKQWERFHEPNRLRLFPNIQWLPSRSATPREEHIPFYHRIWPKDDPFWDHNQPGALWNCKCDWVEVKNKPTDTTPEGEEPKSVSPKGLDGNPAKTGELFTATPPEQGKKDRRHPYFTKDGDYPDNACRKADRNYTARLGRSINKGKQITTTIDGTSYEFDFDVFRMNGAKVDVCHHFAASMFGDDSFWLKNEILLDPQRSFARARLVTQSGVDLHNVGNTLKLKEATDKFFYFSLKLADGTDIFLHVGRYKTGKLYLYSASAELPEYVKNSR